MLATIIIIFQIILLFFLSGFVKKKLYSLLFGISKSNTVAMAGITALLYPGTVVHELAHLMSALILFVPVKKLTLEPERGADGMIYAGSVEIARVDVFRRTLVGIAPLPISLIILYFLTVWTIPAFLKEPSFRTLLTIDDLRFTYFAMPYLIFSVSASMFSSKKDLDAARIVLPIIVGILVLAYLLGVPFSPIAELLSAADSLMRVFVSVLLIPLILHAFIAGFLALVVK